MKGLEIRSLVHPDGTLEVTLVPAEVPPPGADEVVVRVEAAPINPSDMGVLFGPADLAAARVSGTPERPILTAKIPERALGSLAARIGKPLPAGNEGAGVVVEAGASAAAQALLGKTVAVFGVGGMYSQLRRVPVAACMALPDGTPAAAGASAFVNPLTALGMIETMRLEGHRALVHTAAASSLGQMLIRLCAKDGIGLVNIVRKPDQVALLRSLGAAHVCDSSAASFAGDLREAIAATGATLAFDAIGGGRMAAQILEAMEAVLLRDLKGYARYGSPVHKQVYLYGSLDPAPTEIARTVGMSWGVGGWLVWPCLQRVGAQRTEELKRRVAAELTTTFATSYARTVSLAGALSLDVVGEYGKRATGAKVLVAPNATG